MFAQAVDILLVEDNDDDVVLLAEAFEEARTDSHVHVVHDGQEALDYLRRRGRFTDVEEPGLVLLDINMPRKNGFQVLAEIKSDPQLRSLPVVVLTSSGRDEDVARSYGAGACSYVRKPAGFERLRDMVSRFSLYWSLVSVPQRR